MNEPARVADGPLAKLVELLVCPRCRGDLSREESGLECPACRIEYLIVDGVVVMTAPAKDEDDEPESDPAAAFARHLRRERAAAESGRRIRRLRAELHIVNDFLSMLPISDTLLDLGCRGGRSSSPMQSAARLLIEADRHADIVRHAADDALNPQRVAALACVPEELPFRDASLDGVVCIRLSHRIVTATRREALLHEILRVAARFVVFSFTDTLSLPNVSRRLRRRPIGAGAMAFARVAAIAAEHGAEIENVDTISPLGSRHRYAALVKHP